MYNIGDIIIYRKNINSKSELVKIKDIHYDSPDGDIYYTICFSDNNERQTISSKLGGPRFIKDEIVYYKNIFKAKILNSSKIDYCIQLIEFPEIIKYTFEKYLSYDIL